MKQEKESNFRTRLLPALPEEWAMVPPGRALKSLNQIIPLETSRAIFEMILYDMTRAIIISVEIMWVLSGKKESLPLCDLA